MIALNHAFLQGIAHSLPSRALDGIAFVEHVRRRTCELPRVHETLAGVDTGAGTFIQWANRNKNSSTIAPFVELVLRMVSGPFLPEERFEGPVGPSLDDLDSWLEDLVRRLLAAPREPSDSGLISPEPRGGADAPKYQCAAAVISNWHNASAFDDELIARAEGSAVDVLLQAEAQMEGQLIVLPSARRSAEAWVLDCRASELHRALLGLETYAAALQECGSDGEALSREACAARYRQRTTIEMSQETGAVRRQPARRRQRTFVAGGYGAQYFDMHAKPGKMTRVHIWTPPVGNAGSRTPIYVGHCGRHLD